MSKLMSRILYFVALPFFLGGILLLLSQLVSSWGKTSVNADEKLGFLLLLVGMLLFTIAWLGALVKMAQLYQRRWFFRLFFGAIFLMTAYIFAGPETAIPPPTDNEDGFLITQWPSYTPYGIQGPPIPRQVWKPKKKQREQRTEIPILVGWYCSIYTSNTIYFLFHNFSYFMEFVEGGVWSFADVLQIKHEGIAIVAGTSRGDGNVIFQSELNG